MASIPSWQSVHDAVTHSDSNNNNRKKGSYDIGLVFGSGGMTGQASIQLEDFVLSTTRKPGHGRFRGGNDLLSLAIQSGGKTLDGKGIYEKRSFWGASGIAVHHSKSAPRQLTQDGYPYWSFHSRYVLFNSNNNNLYQNKKINNRTATEARVYLVPKKSFLEELFVRVRKWDRQARATLFEHDLLLLDKSHVACGAKLQLIRTPTAKVSSIIETGVTVPYVRGELDGFLKVKKDHSESWIELRGSVKHLHPKGGLAEGCLLPPSGELYIAGGSDTVKGLKEGGMLPESAHSSFLLPATTVATASMSRLCPLDESLGLLLFLDSAVASGPGNPSPETQLSITSDRYTWSTHPVLSCGVGFYLRAAPQVRAGLTAPIDPSLRSSTSRQQFFIVAAGDL